MNFFSARCPAKINLFLKLTGRRDDGYHELESLFAFLDLADELTVTKKSVILESQSDSRISGVLNSKEKLKRSSTLCVKDDESATIEVTGEFASFLDPQKNLFTEILDFFAAEFGITKNLHIKIKKNIPVGAGLGGGSSDAAFFMKGLNEIFSLNLSKEELQKISLKFGSDIAFFFEDHASLVKGRGEIIENFPDFKPITALLVNPRISLPTKEVFQKFDVMLSPACPEPVEGSKHDSSPCPKLCFDPSTGSGQAELSITSMLKNFPNDLTKPAIAILPLISEILAELKNSGAKIAKMSGSGASCFGIFSDEKKLDEAAKKFPKFFVKKVKILSHV
jgi:4-diphosphocytidyl-2-C-methyl-D-erythritol kinase